MMTKFVEEFDTYDSVQDQYKGHLIFVTCVCLVGILFNLVGVIHMLIRRTTSNCFIKLLATMALTDLLLLGISTSMCFAFLVKG